MSWYTGTLRATASMDAPVLGVACGSLGALSAVSAEELAEALERVRAGDWIARSLPALAIREILLRTSPLRRGRWLNFIVACIVLAATMICTIVLGRRRGSGPETSTATTMSQCMLSALPPASIAFTSPA